MQVKQSAKLILQTVLRLGNNRLIWNFTSDITGGEVAYALNYNIRGQNGDVSGRRWIRDDDRPDRP